jgi:hypothetical protein
MHSWGAWGGSVLVPRPPSVTCGARLNTACRVVAVWGGLCWDYAGPLGVVLVLGVTRVSTVALLSSHTQCGACAHGPAAAVKQAAAGRQAS